MKKIEIVSHKMDNDHDDTQHLALHH